MFIDIRAEDPDGYAAWLRAGADFRFPGGESLQEHSDRVAAALTDILAVGELPALVVCHRGSIRAVLCRSDPRGLDAFHEYDVPNTGVVRLVSRLPAAVFAALVPRLSARSSSPST